MHVLPCFIVLQGNISRQEAVSMIPPLLLDVKPHHKVGHLFKKFYLAYVLRNSI